MRPTNVQINLRKVHGPAPSVENTTREEGEKVVVIMFQAQENAPLWTMGSKYYTGVMSYDRRVMVGTGVATWW